MGCCKKTHHSGRSVNCNLDRAVSLAIFCFGTLNLCVGLANKKDSVIDHLNINIVDICALQETEIVDGFPEQILICENYILRLECNDVKKRTGSRFT